MLWFTLIKPKVKLIEPQISDAMTEVSVVYWLNITASPLRHHKIIFLNK